MNKAKNSPLYHIYAQSNQKRIYMTTYTQYGKTTLKNMGQLHQTQLPPNENKLIPKNQIQSQTMDHHDRHPT